MLLATRPAVFLLVLAASALAAQQPALQPTTAAQAPTRDTSYIDAQGTAHVTRVVPIPQTISPQAQRSLARQVPDEGPPQSLAERRKDNDSFSARGRIAWSKLCPVQIAENTVAGIPVHIVTPDGMPTVNSDKVLMNLHGGGFNADSGSYTESIPIASFTGIKVVSVLYRLAPEHPFPAAVDDAIAVYKELLKTYKPEHIVIYGTSAGAILTGEVAVRIKQLGLPIPAALGIFSGMGDFARAGTPPPSSRWAVSPARSSLLRRRSTRNTSAAPIRAIRSCRPSTPICAACRPHCSSPASATCCSAAP